MNFPTQAGDLGYNDYVHSTRIFSIRTTANRVSIASWSIIISIQCSGRILTTVLMTRLRFSEETSRILVSRRRNRYSTGIRLLL